MSKRNRQAQEVTKVSIVEDALKLAEDFRTLHQLAALLAGRCTVNQISASLSMLKKYRAVDVVESESLLWWFSTPDLDTRQRVVELRQPEDQPRRTRHSSRPYVAEATAVYQPAPAPTARASAGSKARHLEHVEANEIAARIRASRINQTK